MPLLPRTLPFDHPEWIFELKYDGFRSHAVIQNGRTQLISRNGNPFNSFADLCKRLTLPLAGKTVVDGEIVCWISAGGLNSAICSFIAVSPAFSHSTC
jgi:bifunctional non-homologous end joining protein LigD